VNETLQELAPAYAAALREHVAEPQEAALMRAYDLGRRALSRGLSVAEVGLLHGQALAAALAGAASEEERARSSSAARRCWATPWRRSR
jgi:hypothetical protein